jgi:hypothetical protein
MDLALAVLAASLQLAPVDSPTPPVVGPVLQPSRFAPVEAPPPASPPALTAQDFEYSSAYYTRLTIHRWGSYAMLPLFAAQYYVGSQLYSGDAADWAEDLHPALAWGIGGLFASNTVTGVWNLWEGRKDPQDRKRKVAHAVLMMAADAGFLTTAILGDEVEDTGSGRATHRAVAITSMAVATTGWLLMTDLFRRD